MQLVAKSEEIHLAPRLAVNELRSPPCEGDSLDFDAPASRHADVHVLSTGAHAGTDVTGGSADPPYEENRILHFVGRFQFRCGDGFDERHSEPVCPPDDEVAPVAYFTTAVLLDAYLRD